jgi:cytochrome c5
MDAMEEHAMRPFRPPWLAAIATAIPLATLAAAPPDRTGKEVVEKVCSTCHATGRDGAPKVADRDAWIPRMKRGLEDVTRSAIRGHANMPARGGMASLTDTEVRAAVAYMFAGREAAPARAPAAAPAADANRKVVGDLEVHLGVLAAEKLRAQPTANAVPKGRDLYHVNVALVDRRTGRHLDEAKVAARVENPFSTETRPLMPIVVKGAASYGNYFRMAGAEPYAITVTVSRPQAPDVDVRFEPRKY